MPSRQRSHSRSPRASSRGQSRSRSPRRSSAASRWPSSSLLPSSPRRSSSSASHRPNTHQDDDGFDYKAAWLAQVAHQKLQESKKRKRGKDDIPQVYQHYSAAHGSWIRRVASLFDEVSEIIITGSTYMYQRDNSPEPDDIDESTDNLTEEEKRYLAEKRESEHTYEAYLQIQCLVPNLDQRVKESSSEALADFFAARRE
ncbi:hypothetical protein B0H10DRAFT_2219682 [Mycena sp. CBHHK59/15]|nr:hypothetical protein B0H10DRAFT_2219682 [Mycena sp. CBHHK59/15]